MSILIASSEEESNSIPEPKQIWIDIDRIVVYTGADIPVIPDQRNITAGEFRDRFTDAEMEAILNLAYSGDVISRKLLLKLQTATSGIDLDSADVINGMAYLMSQSILTQARNDEILA